MGNKVSGNAPRKGSSGNLSSPISVSGRYHRLPKRMEDDYSLNREVLGTGYNGAVYKATGRHCGRTYAVKGFHLHGVSPSKKAELKAEGEIFLQMDHPHIARLVAVYESTTMLYLVMECMDGGELLERLVAHKHFHEQDAAHCVWQMLLAVNYIHSHDVVHRDLKLENFLYETKSNDHLKLIDFGFSKIWDTNVKMRLSCGTLAYVAPEVLDRSYTSQCDLWSLGVVCFILILGYMPFDGCETVQMKYIRQGAYRRKQPHWSNMSDTARDFITSLLHVDPNERLTAEQALKHSWIADRDQSGRYHITPLARLDSGECEKSALNVDNSTIDALCSFAQASKFRRACLSLMAWSLSMEERAMVRDAFIELDVERQGTIKLYQLKEILQAKFDMEDEKIKPLIDSLSAANGEEIHYSEFLAAMVSTRIAMHEEHLVQTFRRFDADGNGFITPEDLKKVLGDSFNQAEMAKLLHEVDPDGDGKISYHQFVEYLRCPEVDESYSVAALKLIDKEKMREEEEGELPVGALPTLKVNSRQPSKEGKRGEGQESAGRGQPLEASAQAMGHRPSQVCAIL